uniref:Bromodomain adjacent to zinc finger domain protein 2B-like n=1 Tax=Saccoglossus kowalevskii TaxID=10224 RepID=A0ABM0MI33_SACKO|nr:PREDICTED: bromodomain adjacent to zinc finger domain protein 2B-like [Saccoglossus kowalevskii]
MDPGESPSQKSPGSRGFFDPAHLLGGHSMFPGRPPTSRDQPPYITHMPSAFSMFNQPLYPPRSPHSDFGGLGSLREGLTSPLGSPNALTHGPLSPTAGLHWPLTASVQLCNLATLGGAAWWRHARSMAGLSEYYSGTLGLTAPTFGSGGREREASPPGFDSLYRQSQAQKSLNGAFCGPLFPPASSVLSLSSPTKSSSPATSTTTSLAMTSTVVSTSSSSSSSSSSKHKGQRGRPKGNSYKNSSNTLRIPGSTSSVSDKSKDSKISQPTLSIPQPSTPVFAHSSVITKASSTTTTSLSSAASSTGVTTAVSPSTKTDSNKKKNGKETSSSDSSSSSSDDSSDDLGSSSDSSSSNSDISSGSDNSDGGNSESDSDDKEMEDILQTKKELEEKQKQLLKQEQQLKKQQQDSLERRLKDQQDVKDQRDQEQRLKQEQLKMQLEQHIKQQQHQLKLQKKAQAEREKAFAAKAQAVAAASQHGLSSINTGALTQVTNSASGTQRSNPTSVITPTKTHKSKSQVAQDGTESGVSSPASKSSTSSTPIVARFRGVDYKDLSTKNSTKDDLSDSDSISSGDSDDSQSVSSDSDSDDGSLSSDESCDDEHTDTDPDLKLTDTSMNNTPVKTSTPIDQGKGRKRSSTGATAPGSVNSSLTAGNTSSRTKRRRMEDEDEARAPLENGWRRETTIRQLGPGDRLRGEVVYYAPCGKKVKTYPEVIRYLEKHRITAISRDNFSFSVKIKIGDFLNPKPDGNNGITYEKMTESQVKRALVQDDPKKLRALERQFKREDKRRATQELARKAAESKMQRKLEQQEMTKRALETKRRRKLDSLRNIQEAKEARRNRALLAAEERRRQKDHLKFLKHQEKLQRLEQMRLEKEMRAQQILEQRRKKKEAQALKKSTELEERMKEREIRRQQAVLMKNQERERRKHLLVMLSSALYEVPFKALSATLKAQCLGYLVNDLVCSQNIVEDIDKNIEHMSSLRRDKWIIEGKLRKMRTLQAKKFNRPMPVKANNLDDSTSLLDTTLETMDGDNSNLSGIGKKRKREDEDEDEEDDDDSDGTEETGADGEDVEDETEPTNADEMDKKIDKLTKQQCQFRNKLFEASHALRAMSFGQDRFRRRFWVLPHAGGIYVEGMASAELPDDMKHELEHQEKLDKKEEIKSQIEPCRETALDLSMPTASSTPGATPKIKTEPEPEQNLFLQKPENFSRLSELLQVAKQEPESDCNALAPSEAVSDAAATVTSHCPTQTQAGLNTFRLNSGLPPVTQAESNAGFVKLDNYVHQKNDSHFAMAASSFSSGQISAEQLLKGLADQPNGTKPWFSILPQMPCNETSRTHSSPNKAMQDSSVPAFGVSAFHIPSGTFSTIPIPGLKTSSASPSLAFPGLAHGFIPVSAMSAFGFPSSLISSATSSPQSLCEASKEFMTAQAQNEAMANMKALLGERENKVAAPIPEGRF